MTQFSESFEKLSTQCVEAMIGERPALSSVLTAPFAPGFFTICGQGRSGKTALLGQLVNTELEDAELLDLRSPACWPSRVETDSFVLIRGGEPDALDSWPLLYTNLLSEIKNKTKKVLLVDSLRSSALFMTSKQDFQLFDDGSSGDEKVTFSSAIFPGGTMASTLARLTGLASLCLRNEVLAFGVYNPLGADSPVLRSVLAASASGNISLDGMETNYRSLEGRISSVGAPNVEGTVVATPMVITLEDKLNNVTDLDDSKEE